MSFFENQYVHIIISSISVYLFIIIAIRVFGKKELSQLSVVDLVFILLISNAVQNAMVGTNSTLVGGLVAAGALFVTNFIFKQFIYHYPQFSKLMQGEPLLLIYQGKLNIHNAARAKMTIDEITEVLREHGVDKIEDVNLAMLEVDGSISVLSNEFQHRTVKKRKTKQSVAQK